MFAHSTHLSKQIDLPFHEQSVSWSPNVGPLAVQAETQPCPFVSQGTTSLSSLNKRMASEVSEVLSLQVVSESSIMVDSGGQGAVVNHPPQRLHSCKFCSFQSPRREELSAHAAQHRKEKPWMCPHCDCKFFLVFF